MKKTILYLSLAALVLTGCAKSPKSGKNDANKRYLEAWIEVFHPEAVRTTLGAYVLEDKPGQGAAAGTSENNPFVRVNYTVRSLDGTVQGTTDKILSQQLGNYEKNESKNPYYGPVVWTRGTSGQVAGVEEALSTMKVGGRRTVVIPGWLLGLNSSTGAPILYDTAQEYEDNVTGSTHLIYEMELAEVISDMKQWQIDSVGRYLAANYPGMTAKDSVKLGFYYIQTGVPSSTESFKSDTTIYINYIGRRLDGSVFDTSIADTAKFYGIYSASRTYGPCSIDWYNTDESYKDITMTTAGASSASSVISGFSFGLDQMHPHEKGTAVFLSNWGYGASGSGSAIPAYSPLRFDFEVVDKPAS